MVDKTLSIWTVYKNPSDYPGKWVLRGRIVGRHGSSPIDDYVVADTLEQIRAAIPPGLYRLNRQVDDDPAIYEVWL